MDNLLTLLILAGATGLNLAAIVYIITKFSRQTICDSKFTASHSSAEFAIYETVDTLETQSITDTSSELSLEDSCSINIYECEENEQQVLMRELYDEERSKLSLEINV